MSRLIVLFLCLASAAAIAGYTHYTRGSDEATPATPVYPVAQRADTAPKRVYTVPSRAPEPVPRPAPARVIEPGDRVTLARALQRELRRVGCYSGEITGVWTASSRMAMKAFTERVNATLPVDNPDHVLLSLVRGHQERVCGISCPEGQTATDGGTCLPDGVLANAAKEGASDASSDKGSATLPAAGATAAIKPAPSSGPVPPEGMGERRQIGRAHV